MLTSTFSAVAASHGSQPQSERQLNIGYVAGAVQRVGAVAVRYSLVVIIAWIGAMKFFEFEAKGISGLVANSPLLSWVYHVLSVRAFSGVLGSVELTIALLLAIRPWSPKASAVGAGLAIPMFLTTLSFLITTPGAWEPTHGGFPFVGDLAGFLLKDIVLLAAAIWSLGDSLAALSKQK